VLLFLNDRDNKNANSPEIVLVILRVHSRSQGEQAAGRTLHPAHTSAPFDDNVKLRLDRLEHQDLTA
jgi:hypothetical protein